jgi:Glycosyl transferase family 2
MTGSDYHKPILCSVLIPTHRRVPELMRAIASVFNQAKDRTRVEVILRCSVDDRGTVHRLASDCDGDCDGDWQIRAIVSHRMDKFDSLPIFFDECARLARGEFIWLFNDDAYIDGMGWDEVLLAVANKIEPLPYNAFGVFDRIYPQHQWDGASCYENQPAGPFPIIKKIEWTGRNFVNFHGGGIDCVIGNYSEGKDHFLSGIGVRHTSQHKK